MRTFSRAITGCMFLLLVLGSVATTHAQTLGTLAPENLS